MWPFSTTVCYGCLHAITKGNYTICLVLYTKSIHHVQIEQNIYIMYKFVYILYTMEFQIQCTKCTSGIYKMYISERYKMYTLMLKSAYILYSSFL